jgi:hypothetical protein
MDVARRSFLKGLPAAAAGAALMNTTSAFADETTKAPALSAVTYLPVAAQKQLVVNAADIKGKDYEKFFVPELEVPTEAARALQVGPLAKAECLTPSVQDINKLFDPSYKSPVQGYAVLDGSTCYVQNTLTLPGVTAEMFRWWFTWHPIERQRYALWFPQAHIANRVEDATRLANTSLSYEDRLYENPNFVTELVGPFPMDLLIRFTDPTKLGLDTAAMKRAGFTASASGTVGPQQVPEATNSLMLHLGRDVDGGMELVSRYWIGAHPELKRFKGGEMAAGVMKHAGFNDQIAEATAYELAVHDMIEFNHLGTFLPALFAEFGKS